MANQNGVGGQNAAGYNAVNGQVTIPAGHYSDMQFLDRNMESLSAALHVNRQEWDHIEELLAQVERLQGRLPRDDAAPTTNGVHPTSNDEISPDGPTRDQLKAQLAEANARAEAMRDEHARTIELYEKTFEDITVGIRQYGHGVQTYLASTVAHYNALLDHERTETIEARLEHQAWQAGLQRVSEGVRTALRAREEEGMPYKSRIAALKEENRILRAKVGWDPPADSDDEDEEQGDPQSALQLDAHRGRSLPSAQTGTRLPSLPS